MAGMVIAVAVTVNPARASGVMRICLAFSWVGSSFIRILISMYPLVWPARMVMVWSPGPGS